MKSGGGGGVSINARRRFFVVDYRWIETLEWLEFAVPRTTKIKSTSNVDPFEERRPTAV